MRVAALWIRHNPFLGDIDLDFRGTDGQAMRHVVIAGANGCGKTAVLEILHSILGFSGTRWASEPTQAYAFIEGNVPQKPENIGYTAPPEPLRAIAMQFRAANPQFQGVILSTGGILATLPDVEVPPEQKQQVLGTMLPSFYSDARVAFDVADVDRPSPLAEELPEAYPGHRISSVATIAGANLGNELAQLLVNLKVSDDEDTARWAREHRGQGQEVPEHVMDRRIRRFREAFATVMPHKRFHDVIRVDGKYQPVFQERGGPVPLGYLSTGEKQIVLRGGFLLRNFEHLPGAVVLVDEPELGLHPSWQEGILEYYDHIAPDDPGRPGQIIVATHSPFVVHGSPAAKHVILRRDPADGRVYADPEAGYRGVTSGDIAVAAFDLGSFTFSRPENRLAVVTEGPTDASIVQAAWNKLRPGQAQPFNLLPARSAGNIQSLLGNEANVLGPLATLVAPLGIERFIGLFDFDGEGFGHWKGMAKPTISDDESLDERGCSRRRRQGCLIWSALLPVPLSREEYASHDLGSESRLTIELLFPDAQVQPLLSRVRNAGSKSEMRLKAATPAQKNAVADACAQFPEAAFAAFAPIFDLVDHVLAFTPP